MRDALIERLLRRAFEPLVWRGTLTVVLSHGKKLTFGDQGLPRAQIRFTDRRAMLALLLDPDLQLGELFVQGRLQIEQGSIYDVLELLLRDAKDLQPHGFVRVLDRGRMLLRPLLERNRHRRARANVAHHYDLDDRLYSLFLGADRQYSCAYFQTGEESLEVAQLAKMRHIAAKLLVDPHHRVLDIGCGWGGLSRYLAEIGGALHVTGTTLSQEQLAGAKRRAAESHQAKRLEYRLEDYRDTAGTFERIVSVGMFEHVGRRNHHRFFRKCHELLADDGVMLLHFIGNSDVPDFNNPWIERYIFPGGSLPSLSECMPAIENAGLVVTDIEVLRLHYAQTLRFWRERFLARRDEARALYDERFCRIWEFYLSMSEAAFHHQQIAVFQIQLARRQDAVPLTRDYIDARKDLLWALETQSLNYGDLATSVF
ncbi:class I SAM-dependent methyltransferase [Variovorax sp. ZT5P30]